MLSLVPQKKAEAKVKVEAEVEEPEEKEPLSLAERLAKAKTGQQLHFHSQLLTLKIPGGGLAPPSMTIPTRKILGKKPPKNSLVILVGACRA